MRSAEIYPIVCGTLGIAFIIGIMTIAERKNDHIEICLRENVRSRITNGFEKYRLIHNALPEADFSSFSVRTRFLEKEISAPLLIS